LGVLGEGDRAVFAVLVDRAGEADVGKLHKCITAMSMNLAQKVGYRGWRISVGFG
jgi:hypothetical protein